ncbi:MAG TPA: TIGR02530 family flagellar biosynthesis protein [Fimbriimonadaceae bacterium]|nr:TIGR02530 family flagellar biosynthesis protein [Fimbriimonadaceae bacterium]
MNIQNTRIQELIQSTPPGTTAPKQPVTSSGPDFAGVLQDQLKVSGHAKTRLESRNIQLGKAEWDRVLDGVNRAAAKGAKESLVMVDNVALVVSVKNRTVITAVDQANLKDNVFTNIDSAVIV